MRRIMPAVTLVVAAWMFALAAWQAPMTVERIVMFTAVYPVITVEELSGAADAVVELTATGDSTVRWNSSDGREWTSADQTRPAYIYTDQRVRITRVIQGTVHTGETIVRKMGGVADGVNMVFEHDPELRPGQSYLVFLREYDTPTQVGTERYWTILWMDRGVFSPAGPGVWANTAAGLEVTESNLRAGER